MAPSLRRWLVAFSPRSFFKTKLGTNLRLVLHIRHSFLHKQIYGASCVLLHRQFERASTLVADGFVDRFCHCSFTFSSQLHQGNEMTTETMVLFLFDTSPIDQMLHGQAWQTNQQLNLCLYHWTPDEANSNLLKCGEDKEFKRRYQQISFTKHTIDGNDENKNRISLNRHHHLLCLLRHKSHSLPSSLAIILVAQQRSRLVQGQMGNV